MPIFPDRKPSAVRLREKLAARDDGHGVYLTEAMYRAQVDYTCNLLDVVDEVTDVETAARITDAILERLAGAEVHKAVERAREVQAEITRLMWRGFPG